MVERPHKQNPEEDRIIVIVGPTASGKTRKAVELSQLLGGEIISGDSRQVYRRMDLGTGKDLEEYGTIPYHLIDICEPGEKYNLHRFVKDFHEARSLIVKKNKKVVVCGGTGMYIETVLSGVKLPDVPENLPLREKLEKKSLQELSEILSQYKTLHNTTDIDTAKRAIRAIEIEEYYLNHPLEAQESKRSQSVPLNSLIIGIDIPREIRRQRISERLRSRLNQGMLEEIKGLLDSGVKPEDLIYYGLEYKYLTLHVIGKITYEEMVKDLETAIHQFAKRQMTWFRGMERRGFHIHWLPYDLPSEEFNYRVLSLLNQYREVNPA